MSRGAKLHGLKIVALLSFIGLSLIWSQPAHANSGLIYRSVDLMKYTKDRLNNQSSDPEIQAIVKTIKDQIDPNYVAVSVPLDDPTGFADRWANAIHAQGMHVIFRGTWEEIEGIYNVPKLVGATRLIPGSLESAATDGTTTWLGKTYKYIIDHPNLFADGDLWGILPERTESIFQDSTSFLPYDGLGIQSNYASFFNDLKKVSDLAFVRIGKNVLTGFTANNFTEVASSWIPQSVFDTAGVTVVDHYGSTHTPQEMDSDIRNIYKLRGKPVFLGEWGDYWNTNLSSTDRTAYLNSMYAVFQKLVDDGILIGFNYWGAWDNNLEGILKSNGNGSFGTNDRGQVLANFFKANGSHPNQTAVVTPPPVPTPSPIQLSPAPAPTPTPLPSPTPVPAPTPTPSPTPAVQQATVNFRDGSLIYDRGIVFVMEHNTKRAVSSMEVFNGLGYKLPNVAPANLENVSDGASIVTPNQRHVRGTVVIDKTGTVYFLGQDLRYPFPSGEVFLSWGNQFKDIVPANEYDLNMALGPVEVKNTQVLGIVYTPLPFGTLVKSSNQTIYVVVGQRKAYPFSSPKMFTAYGFDFDRVRQISDIELNNYDILRP